LDGRLQGAYRTVYRGSSLDFSGLRDYTESDDARRIDWNSTARLGEPQVRQFTEDRELTAWLVLDRSASMALGAAGRTKHDVLSALSLLLGRLFGQGGNRVGAVLYDGSQTRIVPPSSGRPQVLRIAHELGRTSADPGRPGREAKRQRKRKRPSGTGSATTTDLAGLLAGVAALARRRSLIIVISDFVGAGLEPDQQPEARLPWEDALSRLTLRHEVVALRIADPADAELPAVGALVVRDAETGEQLLVDTSDPLFRARLAAQAEARDSACAAAARRVGVPFHLVSTTDDLLDALVRIVTATKARR
jgi:uncharacterized protein (DUF58 family)